jgi:hypothetical protein
MIIDDALKCASLHEAGHAVAYYLLQHQSGGIAARKEGLIFCNLVAPDSPPMGDAAGSAAELLILGKYDESGARKDQTNLGLSPSQYTDLVNYTMAFLSPYKRNIKRIHSKLIESVRWRTSLDDFPDIVRPVGGMNPPDDGYTYSLIIPIEEIAAAVTQE